MFYFLTYRVESEEKVHRFTNIKDLFAWVEKWRGEHGGYPPSLCIYEGTCIFDGSV